MAITIAWDETLPANGDAVSAGASRIRDDKQGTRERTINGGHYWPQSGSTDAKSGIHCVSANNYVANEWSLYKSDLTTKLFTATDTAFTLNTASSVTCGALNATTLSESGTRAVLKSAKRIIVLNAAGSVTYPTASTFTASEDRPALNYIILYMPLGPGGTGTPYTGNVVEAVFTRVRVAPGGTTDTNLADITSVNLKKYANASFLNSGSSTTADINASASSILSGAFTFLSTYTGYRCAQSGTTTTISTPSVSGGDVFVVTYAATAKHQIALSLVIEVDYP